MSRSSGLIEDWAKLELKKYLRPNMKVVILGYSFFGNLTSEKYNEYYGPDSEYATKMAALFETYKISDVKWIYYYNKDIAADVELVNAADILYLPGGAPDLMYDRIVEKGLLDVLRAFNKTVIGSSAGAMIQLKQFHISPDNEYNKFSLHEGLSYIDNFFIEVHYRRRVKQKSSMRKMRRTYKLPIYTIPDDGMVIVSDNKILTLGNAKQTYNKEGIIR